MALLNTNSDSSGWRWGDSSPTLRPHNALPSPGPQVSSSCCAVARGKSFGPKRVRARHTQYQLSMMKLPKNAAEVAEFRTKSATIRPKFVRDPRAAFSRLSDSNKFNGR